MPVLRHKEIPAPYLLFDSRESRNGRIPNSERALHEPAPHIEEGQRLIDELLGR